MHHQAKVSTRVARDINNLMNKDTSPTTSACDDFSINEPTPNILLFSSIKLPNPTIYPIIFITHV
jgi:hypothetical protein